MSKYGDPGAHPIESPAHPPSRGEAYWQERNALVDAVHAAGSEVGSSIDGTSVYMAGGWDRPGAEEIRARYRAALAALEAFDAEHGGAPIL